MTAVILLNWNGWEVTLDCLRSLRASVSDDMFIIVADNGSSDDSTAHIVRFFKEEWGCPWYDVSENDMNHESLRVRPMTGILLRLNENYGFAGGNNRAVELARRFSPEYMILLNNDTEIEPDALQKLKEYADTHKEYDVFTPLICYYSDKDLIWNCGGKLFMGMRKYYYARERVESLPAGASHLDINFVTGCALFFRTRLLEDGPLLTERFFYGEEDFFFSMRMKEEGVRMACVLGSRIYHKVSVSIRNMNNLGKIYIYYLNRFIDMRLHMSGLGFTLWQTAYIPYIKRLLTRQGFTGNEVKRLTGRLRRECRSMDGVPKDFFFKVMKEGV